MPFFRSKTTFSGDIQGDWVTVSYWRGLYSQEDPFNHPRRHFDILADTFVTLKKKFGGIQEEFFDSQDSLYTTLFMYVMETHYVHVNSVCIYTASDPFQLASGIRIYYVLTVQRVLMNLCFCLCTLVVYICMIVGWAVRICACTLWAVCAFCLRAAVQLILYVYEQHTKKGAFENSVSDKGRATDRLSDRRKYWERWREKDIPHTECGEMLWSNFAAGVSATQTSTLTDFQTESSNFHSLMTLSTARRPHKSWDVAWHLSATVLITTWNDCISRRKWGNRPLGNKEFSCLWATLAC